jgi:glycosyltransferase involved in cell wall biosynthesis
MPDIDSDLRSISLGFLITILIVVAVILIIVALTYADITSSTGNLGSLASDMMISHELGGANREILKSNSKFNLSLMAIFKNENHILEEWLDHHIDEGIDHFFLINNGSTDGYQETINKYGDKITLFNRSKPYNQIGFYNQMFAKIKDMTEWLIICDLDEFLWTPSRFGNMKSVLNTQPANIGQVSVIWTMFGSSGHKQQPENVVSSFTWRRKNGLTVEFKSIVRTKAVKELIIHEHILLPGFESIKYGNLPTEESLRNSPIRLNHYAIQSWDFFNNVKMKRGDVVAQILNSVRNEKYFKDYDHKDLQDFDLIDKKKENLRLMLEKYTKKSKHFQN